MDNFDFEKDKREIQERKKRYQEQKEHKAKKRLTDRLVKNMETIMIGALEEFEVGFGYLWNYDVDEEKVDFNTMTEEQREMYKLWQEVRTEILDRSNHKIMQSEKEIDKYNVSFVGYQYKFNFKDRK